MPTIKDVAKLAQVSSATVSRILNNDATLSVPEETRRTVLQAAETLHYIKKRRAPKHIYTMGIVQWYTLAQEMEDPYYLQIRQGIETFCEQNGVRIQRIFKADWQNTDALPAVDGLLCVGKFTRQEAARFKQHTSKLVFLDMEAPQPGDSSITLDFEQAVGAALCYLQGLGHTRIGYLGGQEFLADGTMYPDARKRWFLDFCKKNGIEALPYIQEDAFTSEAGYRMMKTILGNEDRPSAVFCASDPIAIGALRALQEAGIRVPEEISLVGFDDINAARFTNPPLTTIHAPAHWMGLYGASLLYHVLSRHEDPQPIKAILPCILVERAPCQKAD